MATKKNTTAKAQTKAQKAPEATSKTPSINVKIDNLVDYEGSKVKAFASANIGGAFAIHGIRVMDSDKGLYVSMPSRSYQKDGKTEYTDVFHPVTSEARTELNNAVMEAYEQKLQESMTEDAEQSLDEEALPFEPKM